MKKADDVINSLFNTKLRDEIKKNEIIKEKWNNSVGSDISAHSFVRNIENNTLVIEIDHPGWGQIINLQKKSILNKLNSSLENMDLRIFQFIVKQGFKKSEEEKKINKSNIKEVSEKSGNRSFDEILENLRKRSE